MPWNNTSSSWLHTTVVTLEAGNFVQVAHTHCHLIHQFITSQPLLHFSSRHLPMAGKQFCPCHRWAKWSVCPQLHRKAVKEQGTRLCGSWASFFSQSSASPLPIHISTSRNASLANKKTHLLPAKSPRLNSQLLFIFFCFQHWRQGGERKEKNIYLSKKKPQLSHSKPFPYSLQCSILSKNLKEISGISPLTFPQNSDQTLSKAIPKIWDAELESKICGMRRRGGSP